MIYELNHFGIIIRDLEKSPAFYQAWREPPRPLDIGVGRIRIIRYPDGVKIELLERANLREL